MVQAGLHDLRGADGPGLDIVGPLPDAVEHLAVADRHRGHQLVGRVDRGVFEDGVHQAGPRARRQLSGLHVQGGADDARLLGRVDVGFGDADKKTLYIAARTSIYKIRVNVPGI